MLDAFKDERFRVSWNFVLKLFNSYFYFVLGAISFTRQFFHYEIRHVSMANSLRPFLLYSI